MDNMMPYCMTNTNKDIIDMDTLAPIRRISECSVGGTSGYNSTTSPGPDNSPQSNGYSPVQSPASVLNNEFSNLVFTSEQQNSNLNYAQLQNVPQQQPQQQLNVNHSFHMQQQTQNINFPSAINFGNPLNYQYQQMPYQQQQLANTTNNMSYPDVKYEYEATLRIIEQPVEKFRFRYKSEMHGTHGSLNGQRSQRNSKTSPEVELVGYNGPAIIRCSLFQTTLESPHSHQLVVRKDDHDICDPHELKVSKEAGYFAEFKNMGIIHTAKKFIVEELLKKKRRRLGRDVLTTKEEQELHKQTEKEAKDMNLNQVRLCFEAFRVEENGSYTPIAAPVYSNPINNRKSAQTGELRIARLSIATGSVTGGDDLILLVEKVSKKNIKVRFYEMVDDEQVWEAFATFRESDVHHQYAIVCRTPAYRDKDIDKPIDVFVELVRPSDDERSYPPVSFRYKPSYAVISRKRRRTCSTFNSSSSSNSGSLSSGDIPKPVHEQRDQQKSFDGSISEVIDNIITNNQDMNGKSENLSNIDLTLFITDGESNNLDKLLLNDMDITMGDQAAPEIGRIVKDGICTSNNDPKKYHHYKKVMISKKQMDIARQQPQSLNICIQRILNIYKEIRNSKTQPSATVIASAAEQISKIINEYSEKNLEPLIHEIALGENNKYAIAILKILDYFKLHDLLNTVVTKRSQTVLHTLCLHGQPNYIRALLKMGCNPDLQDCDGNTALHIAVLENHLKCLQSFINSNIPLNINELNDDGFTPLHLAIRDNKYEFVEKLLEYDNKTLLTKCQKDGSNALHMAVQQQNLKLVNLTSKNSSILFDLLNTKNRSGYTPLDLAKQHVTNDEQAKQILNHLLSVYNSFSTVQKMEINNDVELDEGDHDDKLIIKEEENSCSSTEDDDEDSNSIISENQSSNTTTKTSNRNIKSETDIKMTNIQNIKQERNEDDFDAYAVTTVKLTINDLEFALNNKDIYTQLCNTLNENNNWKQLASDLNMQLPCFRNAETFLNSLRRKLQTINYENLTKSLETIDKSLIDLLKNK